MCKGGRLLVEVDVQHDCFSLTADHKRLVKSLEHMVIQTLAPVTKQLPDPFIHCVCRLPISLMHVLPSIILWHETGMLQDLKSHKYDQKQTQSVQKDTRFHIKNKNMLISQSTHAVCGVAEIVHIRYHA